eukprot:6927422-Prymnesium_polylepis.1
MVAKVVRVRSRYSSRCVSPCNLMSTSWSHPLERRRQAHLIRSTLDSERHCRQAGDRARLVDVVRGGRVARRVYAISEQYARPSERNLRATESAVRMIKVRCDNRQVLMDTLFVQDCEPRDGHGHEQECRSPPTARK